MFWLLLLSASVRLRRRGARFAWPWEIEWEIGWEIGWEWIWARAWDSDPTPFLRLRTMTIAERRRPRDEDGINKLKAAGAELGVEMECKGTKFKF